MPTVNPDFHLLKEIKPETIETARSGVEYSMLNLEDYTGQNIVIEGERYTISDHHISVYATYERINYKSNYHYTAHLKSSNDEDVTLHIYFDTAEELRNIPRLTYSNNQLINISPQAEEELVDLARVYCLPTIKKMRAEHSQIITNRGKRFDQKLACLYEKPMNQILDEIDSLIIEATQLELIGGKKRHQYLELYKQSLLSQQRDSTSKYQDSAITQDANSSEMQVVTHKSSTKPIPSRAQLQLQQNQADFDVALEGLADTQESVKTRGSNNQDISVEDAEAFASQARDCLALSIATGVICSSEQLKVLQTSLINSEELCINILSRAIIGKDEETYTNSLLETYIKHIPEKVLGLLLNIKSTEAFCWLLNNGKFEPNTIEVTFNKSSNPVSLLEKAFESNNLSCFVALLENGANPLFITKTGRPFAHDVLQGSDDFKNAVLDHYIGKNQLPKFFKKLISLCTTCVFDPKYTNEDRHEINDSISIYELHDVIPENVSATNIRVASELSKKLSELTSCSNARIRELRNMPQCRTAFNEFADALKDFSGTITQEQQRAINAQCREQLSTLENETKDDSKADDRPMSPEEFVRILGIETEILYTKKQITELTEQFNNSVKKGGQLRTNKLTKQSKQIRRELSAAEEKLAKLVRQSSMSPEMVKVDEAVKAMSFVTNELQRVMAKSRKSLSKLSRRNGCTKENVDKAMSDYREMEELLDTINSSRTMGTYDDQDHDEDNGRSYGL